MRTPPIPLSFKRKKAKILAELSVPAEDYTDKSPKGSVDEAIRELINEVNGYEGLVTTSSCAGRISVFLEGKGSPGQTTHGEDAVKRSSQNDDGGSRQERRVVPGGKGGGEFLFTSHEPVQLDSTSLMDMFRLKPVALSELNKTLEWRVDRDARMVRVSFEPMILHIMAASLKHAQPVLSAAINAGFRESGVQSLRNLDEPAASPMVAVRTAGLALESIIGCAQPCSAADFQRATRHLDHDTDQPQALVDVDYLAMLVRISNERFISNSMRITRLRTCLRDSMNAETKKMERAETWEDPEARRHRKKQEGFRKKDRKGDWADLGLLEELKGASSGSEGGRNDVQG